MEDFSLQKCIEDAKRNAVKLMNSTDDEEDDYEDDECRHKWIFQMSDYDYRYNTYGNSEYKRYNTYGNGEYKRYDTYYCEKCLEIKEVLAKYECSRERPYWFKG